MSDVAQPRPLPKPRKLNARKLSAKQLARAARISPTDIQHAQAAWRADAPRPYRALLDAHSA